MSDRVDRAREAVDAAMRKVRETPASDTGALAPAVMHVADAAEALADAAKAQAEQLSREAEAFAAHADDLRLRAHKLLHAHGRRRRNRWRNRLFGVLNGEHK